MLSIFIIRAGLTYTLGRMTGSPGHGWAVFAAMYVLFAAGFAVVLLGRVAAPSADSRRRSRPAPPPRRAATWRARRSATASPNRALFATITTDASCGAVNSMHDSFTPLGGMVPLANIMLGEVVFGGVGAGLYGMLIFVVLAVFIAGLMVGRTPEYLGKKIESYDVKMSMLYVLIFPLIILTLAAIFVLSPSVGLSAIDQSRPARAQRDPLLLHFGRGQQRLGLCGLGTNWWYNVAMGWDMLIGPLPHDDSGAGAGRQPGAEEERSAVAGNLPGETPLFTVLLIGVILIVGALTFFPALSLGPILEHLLLQDRQLF